MTSPAPLSYDRAVHQVKEMTRQGSSLAHIEDAIALSPAPEEEEAALWLFAWSLRESSLGDARLLLSPAATTGGGDWR